LFHILFSFLNHSVASNIIIISGNLIPNISSTSGLISGTNGELYLHVQNGVAKTFNVLGQDDGTVRYEFVDNTANAVMSDATGGEKTITVTLSSSTPVRLR